MRISGNSMDTLVSNNIGQSNSTLKDNDLKQGSSSIDQSFNPAIDKIQQVESVDNSDNTKAKVQEAVNKMNEMLEVNDNTSKFMYHEGLDRYYVTIVNRETDEVVKEIPPKKLLDAFYEMQKMLGMVVDEKI